MSIIRKLKKQHPWVAIDKTPLEDTRLSFKARGLMAYLLCKPDNWKINVKHLASASDKDGKEAVQSALKELELLGYIARYRGRNSNGRITGWELVVFETFDDAIAWREEHPKVELANTPAWANVDSPSNGFSRQRCKPESGSARSGKPDNIVINENPNSIINERERLEPSLSDELFSEDEGIPESIWERISEGIQQVESEYLNSPTNSSALPNKKSESLGKTDNPTLGSNIPPAAFLPENKNTPELPYKLSNGSYDEGFVKAIAKYLSTTPHYKDSGIAATREDAIAYLEDQESRKKYKGLIAKWDKYCVRPKSTGVQGLSKTSQDSLADEDNLYGGRAVEESLVNRARKKRVDNPFLPAQH